MTTTLLTRQQVGDAMNAVQGQVHACAQRMQKAGTVGVSVIILPTGGLKSVQVSGMFAGTPVGDCVADAVRRVRFPPFAGSAMPVNYPFVLR